jgi:hypothetical protein
VTWHTPSAEDLQAGTTTRPEVKAPDEHDGTPPPAVHEGTGRVTTRELDHREVVPGDDVDDRSTAPRLSEPADPLATRRDAWWPRDGRAWVRFAVPPLAGFLFAQAVLYAAAIKDHTTGDYFSPSHWARFDSGIYLSIAAHGYTTTTCTGPLFPPHSVCGSIGWSPLYPWLIAGLGHLGLPLATAGLLLAWLFAYLTLQALWALIGPEWSFSKLCCLAFAACFPGMVYAYALFPISLLTFLTVVCLLLFIRRHYLLAGLVGALCPWAYATGVLVAAVMLLAALLVTRGAELRRAVLQGAGVACAGAALFVVANRLWSGSWTAYFASQSKYGNRLHDPVATFVQAFTGAPPAHYEIANPNVGYNYMFPKAQTAFLALLVLGLVAWTLWRRPVARSSWVILVYTVVVWVVPLTSGPTLGRYRVEALLVPCAALCTRLPKVCQVLLLGCAVWLAIGLTGLFSSSILV